LTLFLNLAAMFAAVQGSQPLTMDEAVQIAEKNAFSVRLQQSVIEKNRQKVNESQGQLGPRVVLSGTYTRFDKETTTSFGNQTIVTQPIDTKQAQASLQLPIDISGNIGKIVRASKANLLASKETLNATRNDVKLAVRRSYLAVLRAEDQVEVAKAAVQDAEERLKNAKAEVEQGTKAKVDVIRIEAQLAQAQSDLLTAQNQVTISKQSLNNSMGRPIETDFEVVHLEGIPPTPASDVATLDKTAQGTRPEVKALSLTREALAYVRRAAERGTQPTLNLAVNYVKSIDAQGFSARDQSTTGVASFNWPIFDSGVTRAQVKEARQDEEQAKIQLEQIQLGISLEVRQALTNMVDAAARLEVAKRQVAAAEENYRIAKVRLAAGEGITLEITDALSQLTQARSGLVAARYDYWTAYSELQRAVGSDELQTALGGKN
jgi:outer membrane protein